MLAVTGGYWCSGSGTVLHAPGPKLSTSGPLANTFDFRVVPGGYWRLPAFWRLLAVTWFRPPISKNGPRASLKPSFSMVFEVVMDIVFLAVTGGYRAGGYWRLLAVAGGYWRLLVVPGVLAVTGGYLILNPPISILSWPFCPGGYWRLLAITGGYWRAPCVIDRLRV